MRAHHHVCQELCVDIKIDNDNTAHASCSLALHWICASFRRGFACVRAYRDVGQRSRTPPLHTSLLGLGFLLCRVQEYAISFGLCTHYSCAYLYTCVFIESSNVLACDEWPSAGFAEQNVSKLNKYTQASGWNDTEFTPHNSIQCSCCFCEQSRLASACAE